MGKKIKWTPPNDAVEDKNSSWTPPDDAIIEEGNQKKNPFLKESQNGSGQLQNGLIPESISIAQPTQQNLFDGQIDPTKPLPKVPGITLPKSVEDEQFRQLQEDTEKGFMGIHNPVNPNYKPGIVPVAPGQDENNAKEFIKKTQSDIKGKHEDTNPIDAFVGDASNFAPSFNKAVISAATAWPKTVGILAQQIDKLIGDKNKKIEDYATYKFGNWIDKKAEEIGLTAIDNKRAGFWNNSVPQAFGSMIGMIMTGGGGAHMENELVKQGVARSAIKTLTSPMAITGALQNSVPEFEAAKAAGKSDEEAFSVFLKNIPGGLTEVIPVADMFGRLNKLTGNGIVNAIKLGASQGLEEGSQEAVQGFLTNLVAKGSYDPNRDLKEGLLEGASAGFITGFILPGAMIAMQHMDAKQQEETRKILREALIQANEKSNVETNQVAEQTANKIESGGNIQFPSEKQQQEDKSNNVDQKTGEIIPRKLSEKTESEIKPELQGIKDELIKGNKIVTDDKGDVIDVKQNSGQSSQLFKDLEAISGDKGKALNEYLAIKDDEGYFKKKFGDWENRIMKAFGRSGYEYKIKVPVGLKGHHNDYVWSRQDANGNPIIYFNKNKIKREKNFKDTKRNFHKDTIRDAEGTPEQKAEYTKLYDAIVNKLRDIKLHLIHQVLIEKMNGRPATIEDKINSLKEIERLNEIPLAKDYYGEPMIFMHGGSEKIGESGKFLKRGDKGYVAEDEMTNQGIYFSRAPKGMQGYARMREGEPGKGKDIYYTFLKTKNPYYMSDPKAQKDYKLESSETISKKDVEALKAKGYDSVIWDKDGVPKKEMIVFDPDQVEIIGSFRNGLNSQQEKNDESLNLKKNASSIESTTPVGEQPSGTQSSRGVGSERVESSKQGSQTSGTGEEETPLGDDQKKSVNETKKKPDKIHQSKESGKKKSLLNRAFEGSEDIDIKEAIKKHGLNYEPETWIHSKERAKQFIKEVGFDKTLDALRKNEIEDGAAAFAWSELIDNVGDQLAETTNEEDKTRLQELESDLIDEFDRKVRSGGRFISALQDVYENSDFGYKLSYQINEYKRRNNGEIPTEIESKFKELDKQLTEAKKQREEVEAKLKKAEEEIAIKNIKESIEREKKQNTKTAQKIKEARSERAKLKSEFLSLYNPAKSGGRLNAALPGATLLEYGIKIANTYIKEGFARLEELVSKTKEYFDKELGYKLDEKEQELIRQRIKERIDELDEKEGKLKISHNLIREYVESGIEDINQLVSRIKEDLKERYPNVTDREIRDSITGYGKIVNPSQDEINAKIRRMTRIGRIISALEDVNNRKRPLRSGKQRDKLDAEERSLNKELRSAMKELPIDEETEAQQLKTSLDAVKSRLKNQIEELNLAIETGKQSAKARGISYDEEAKKLADERDQIKEIYDSIFYKREDDATKIENVLRATEKAIENTIKKIETNDLEASKKGKINSPDIKEAKDRLKRLKDRLEQLKEEAGIPQKRKLQLAKERIKKQIEELKDRLETGNFAKKQKALPIIRDDELLKLDSKIAALKDEFAKEQYKVELKNRTKVQKAIDAALEIWGLTRVLRATGEFSFVLIQNWVYTISHPITAFNAIKTAFSHFMSEKKHNDFVNSIRAQEYYGRVKASKLAIAETDVKLSAREEMFIGQWGNKLWDLLGYPLTPWKPAYEKWKSINPLKAFERAGTGFLNTVRLTRYLEGEEMLRLQGKNFRDNPEEYKNLADVINTFTGRASLGVFERVAKPLAVVFFSPRNWASIIKQTTPYAFYHFGKMTTKDGKISVAQKMAMSDYLVAIGTTTALIMLAEAASGDDDDRLIVEKDPRSSDFMKLRLGNTRIDPWGGRQNMIVLQARLLMNSIKNEKGQVKILGQGNTSTGADLLAKIAKNKLAPSTALGYQFLSKKVKIINGRQVWLDEFGNELYPDPIQNIYPIYWQTVSELYKDQPASLASLIIFMSFWGLGTQTYDGNEYKKKRAEFYQQKAKEIEEEAK